MSGNLQNGRKKQAMVLNFIGLQSCLVGSQLVVASAKEIIGVKKIAITIIGARNFITLLLFGIIEAILLCL